MSAGLSTFFYGLFISAPSLIVATKAYKQLQPTFLALDLISLRRRQSTLQVVGGSTSQLGDIPVEVWEMVRGELVLAELDSAERTILRRIQTCCPDCATTGCRSTEPWLTWGLPPGGCGRCSDTLRVLIDQAAEKTKNSSLLRAYGLARPSPWPIDHNDDPSDLQYYRVEDVVTSTVMHLSPEAIAAAESPAVHRRFRSFVRTWHLDVVEESTGVVCGGPDDLDAASEDVELGQIEPRWMLWTMCQL